MVKGEGRWCQWWSETRGRRRSRRSLREPPARKQTDRPSDNEGEKSAKRHTRTQSSFLGQRDRSRRMGVPARGGRTRGAGGGWRRRGSPSRARGRGRGIPVARGRAPARSWSRVDGNAPPPSPLLGRPGDRGAVHGGEILKKTRDAARCRDRRSRARDERRRRPRDARARARGPRRLVRDPRRGGAARTSARRARISPARLLPSRRAARGEGGKPGGSARPVAGARGGFERGTHLSACSASLALYTRSARDRPARSSGAVIGLMAGGRGRASANAARVGCGPMGPRRSRPRVREPSSERP